MLLLPDKWLWDFWLAEHAGEWHVFFLQADKRLPHPDERHWHPTIGHAVSGNLEDWKYLGTVLSPASGPAFDDAATWTGSIIRHGGEWLMFYTGNARADDAKRQRIGLARSPDLATWTRDARGALLDDLPPPYENRHFPGRWHDRSLRDPYVTPDPVRGDWRMHFTARVESGDADGAGCIGVARSENLLDWKVLPPAVSPGIAGELEVPQLMELEGRWYLLFCTAGSRLGKAFAAAHPDAARRSGTHYFMSHSPDGPWSLGPGMFFAGDEQGSRYAGKLVRKDGNLFFLGFLNHDPEGGFVGGLSDPTPVLVAADGSLSLDQ
jgi:beta-fructofuranosidase